MYIITVKGKEVSRHEKEQDARSEFSRLRTKHGIDVKVRKESVSEGSFWGRDDMVAYSKADDKKHGRVTLRKSDGTGTHGVTTADKRQIAKLKSQGYKVVEDAPANATGSAVVGTGDDSSTVVVKKKKPLQDKLMKRMGIKEAIDRAVPDLEYPEDEITKRKNQLKEMAAQSEKKKLPYDKETDQPKKYVAGLSDKDKKAHDRHLEKQGKKSDSDKSAYTQSPADKKAKTKPSVHTKKYKQMFGEGDVELNEVIKGLKKKAEKSGMPYSILKQVYNRGMAAWKGGHRPGTTPQQWAFARVNSFITKSSGTWGKADKDLAAKVRGRE